MEGPTSSVPGGQSDSLWFDVPIGPDGGNPSILLPRILNFLADDDIFRSHDWSYKFTRVVDWLRKARKGRLAGDLGYESPHVRAMLDDALIRVDTHERFFRFTKDKTRWSTDVLSGKITSDRLKTFPNQFIQPYPNRARYKRKRLDPPTRPGRLVFPFPSLSTRGNKSVTEYRAGEEDFFNEVVEEPGIPKNKEGVNPFQLDNEEYERCILGGIEQTAASVPDVLASDLPTLPNNARNNIEFYKARGWQRAALQQCLNLFDSHENRVINTPWRRVVLPLAEPLPMPKEIPFTPRVLSPDKVTDATKEPYPWVHGWSQHTELENFMAEWQRRRYSREEWNDFQRSALFPNFRGPFLYTGLSIYEDHWLRIGAYLKRLRVLLQDRFAMAPRPFMRAILRDIEAGTEYRSEGELTPRQARRDIMRRAGIDETIDPKTKKPAIKLIDEADAAWLRFLGEPSRSVRLCDSRRQPQDNLSLLFETRLIHFLNDPVASNSQGTAGLDIFKSTMEQWQERRNISLPSLDEALVYINGGGDAAQDHTNRTYQFSRREAEHFLYGFWRRYVKSEVETVGSEGALDKYEESITSATTLRRPEYDLHPEDLIAWRHSSELDFDNSQEAFAESLLEHLVKAYKLSELKSLPEGHFDYAFDHLGRDEVPRILTAALKPPVWTDDDALLVPKELIYGEQYFQDGAYPPNSVEAMRSSPSWQDIRVWNELAAQKVEYFKVENGENLSVPEVTAQFFRNLAYRMGRTIAHAEEIEQRLQYSVPSSELGAPAKTGRWKPISREAFDQEKRQWNRNLTYATGEIEFRRPTPQKVIEKADPMNGFRRRFPGKQDDWSKIIREGIIEDCVQNRRTIYPGRKMVVEDSSGYHYGDNDYAPSKKFHGIWRPSLFKWATESQRRFQAPYTRGAFFDMARWPVHRQSRRTQAIIRRRKDEVLKRDPSVQRRATGILTPRIPEYWEKSALYGASLYPLTKRFEQGPLDGTKQTTSEQGTKKAESTKARGQFGVSDGTKTVSGTKPTESTKPPAETSTSTAPTGTAETAEPTATSNNPTIQPPTNEPLNHDLDIFLFTDITYDNMSNPFSTDAASATSAPNLRYNRQPAQYSQQTPYPSPGHSQEAPVQYGRQPVEQVQRQPSQPRQTVQAQQQTPTPKTTKSTNPSTKQPTTTRPAAKLVPFTRPQERFIPGPAVFPMAETLLQQVALSQNLENALFPKQELGWFGWVGKKYKDFTTVEPKRIPLLPDAWGSEIPRSNPRKRKVPAAFVNCGVPPAKKQTAAVKTSTAKSPKAKPTKPVQASRQFDQALEEAAAQPQTAQPPVTQPSQPATGLFGGPATSQPTGLFGPQPGGLFGKATAQPGQSTSTTGLFGTYQSGQPATTGLFQPTAQPAATQPPAAQTPATAAQPVTSLPGTTDPNERPVYEIKIPQNVQPKSIFGKTSSTPTAAAAAASNETSTAAPSTSSLTNVFPAGWDLQGQQIIGLSGALQAIANGVRLQDVSSSQWAPTANALGAAFRDPAVQPSVGKTTAYNNTFLTTLHQANAALQHWAKQQGENGFWVQLGLIQDDVLSEKGYSTYLFEAPSSDNNYTIWVHSNGSNTFSAVAPKALR
ncbi:hypothetical protein M426DRAFT_267283 [Hypoxylon sp. CI-4A]|nr:hypothetical protein M426DRAFT_267283 [Hypoxylon sp. CI-4A]